MNIGQSLPYKEQWQLVSEAARAPSAHNVQPARWHFDNAGNIFLLEDRTSLLPIADPTEKDHYISLGAALEGMQIAASRLGYKLSAPDYKPNEGYPRVSKRYRLVARMTVADRGTPSELCRFVEERATFRKPFMAVDNKCRNRLSALLTSEYGVATIDNHDQIRQIAALHDDCNMELLKQPGFFPELYRWLRFNRRDPLWYRDGLNSDVLGLSVFERIGGLLLMRPWVFERIKYTQLAKKMFTERAASTSAACMFVILSNPEENKLEVGRRFYRIWLEITRYGLGACPMSAVVDHTFGREHIAKITKVSPKRIINMFRVGGLPYHRKLTSRLPVKELLV